MPQFIILIVAVLLLIGNILSNSRIMHRNPTIIAESELKKTADLLIANHLIDMVIPSRTFAGRLLAYTCIDPSIYRFIEDTSSGAHGRLNLCEIYVGNEILRGRFQILQRDL